MRTLALLLLMAAPLPAPETLSSTDPYVRFERNAVTIPVLIDPFADMLVGPFDDA